MVYRHDRCAFCGGPLRSCFVGSGSEASQKFREKIIENNLLEIKAGHPLPEDPHDSAYQANLDYQEARKTFDPDLVSQESINWVRDIYAIGCSPPRFRRKFFITGTRGYYDEEDGFFTRGLIATAGHSGKKYVYFRWSNEADEFEDVIEAMPFHWCCLEILTRAITGRGDVEEIDNKILDDVLIDLSTSPDDDNVIDYGPLFSCGLYWKTVPGEEFRVSHPIDIPGLRNILRKEAARDIFSNVSLANNDLHEKAVNDPFGQLPYDILHVFLSFLPGKDAISLMKASWHIHNATRNNQFWERLIYRDMPWFWELREVIEAQQSEAFDFRTFYLWLDKVTIPVYGMRGPFLGIANRRRIWSPCQQIADMYLERVRRKP